MKAISFKLKQALVQRLDASPLAPDRLQGRSLEDVGAVLLQYGNQKVRVDDMFNISGSAEAGKVEIEGHDKMDFIARGMTAGEVVVHGSAGSWAGMDMRGGVLTIDGHAGAYAACEMKGGMLEIRGDAGDFLGGALPGNQKGISGGLVLVRGNAGDRLGDHMRRGVILVEGHVGDYLGSRMAAGTIAVLGKVGGYPGFAMKRGTLLMFSALQKPLHATFVDCGSHTLGFLPLLMKSFTHLDSPFAGTELDVSRVQRYAGDLSVGGKGEILVVR